MAGVQTSKLNRKLINDVFGGRAAFLRTIVMTNTGTGLGAASYKLGQFCLDSSSGDWFLCTATTGTGTWVQINA